MRWILSLACLVALPAQAQNAEPFMCPPMIAPVMRLDYGSRYVSADKSRSVLDDASNAEVNSQLQPVDDFISDMAFAANTALATQMPEAVDCVVTGLAQWAKAHALEDMGSLNAQLSVPSRVAGLAFAWAEVAPMVAVGEDATLIEAWLLDLSHNMTMFFDTDAPKKASRNNLRAWAALAVARIGITLDDKAMMDWAAESVRLVACTANPDGSLPLEMARKDKALHYQLHALTALIPAAVLLQHRGYALFADCDAGLHRSVRFTISAFADPSEVTAHAKAKQSYFNGKDELQGFEVAWASAYLSLFHAPSVTEFILPFTGLANSKLGGLQSLLWQSPQ
jgi:poly(beta-D-mannuronate) lyase